MLAEEIVKVRYAYFFEEVLSASVSAADFLKDPKVQKSLNYMIEYNWTDLLDTASNPYWVRYDITDSDYALVLQKIYSQLNPITNELLKGLWLSLLEEETSSYNNSLTKLQSTQNKLTSFPHITSTSIRNELLLHTTSFIMQSERLEKCLITIRSLGIPLPSDTTNDPIEKSCVSQIITSQSTPKQNHIITSSERSPVVVETKQSPSIDHHIVTESPVPHSTEPSTPTRMLNQPDPDIAVFKRQRLVGGSIHDIENNELISLIPEAIIKKLNLQHGDRVRIINRDENGKVTIDLYEKYPEEGNWRELEYCIVSKRYIGETIKYVVEEMIINGERQAIQTSNQQASVLEIKDEDLKYHKIEDGDIVNISFWKGRIDKFRVIWKHRI